MSKKLTTIEFINRAVSVHGLRYDYFKTQYVHIHAKIKIICKKHNIEFLQTPNNHLRGQGCFLCANETRNIKTKSNTQKFINAAKKSHGDKYDYSNVTYVNTNTKVSIKCIQHDCVFLQRPDSHLSGSGCPLCGIEKIKINKTSNTEIFIKRAKNIHNNFYDYTNTKYEGSHKKVIITCPLHGDFIQEAGSHLNKNGCPTCGRITSANCQRGSLDEFLDVVLNMDIYQMCKYDYSKFNYIGALIKSTIICPKHGAFQKSPSAHKRGQGCPVCSHVMSHGERKIAAFLYKHKIEYMHNKTFVDLLSDKNRHLRYDFFLPTFNFLIEYDGPQHFAPVRIKNISERDAKETHTRTKANDIIKNKYATVNNYPLFRIHHTDFNNIETILLSKLKPPEY